jgi:hypothetical protein
LYGIIGLTLNIFFGNYCILEDKKDKKKKGKKGDKEKMSLDQYLDEVYQLDYEDMVCVTFLMCECSHVFISLTAFLIIYPQIGDLPTRFKYRKVEADTFGLKPDEILYAPDSALNDLMPLKRLAPFRPPEKLERDRQIFAKQKKKKLRAVREAVKATLEGITVEEMEAQKKEAKEKKGQAAKKKEKKARQEALKKQMEEEQQQQNKKKRKLGEPEDGEEEAPIALVIEPTPEELAARETGANVGGGGEKGRKEAKKAKTQHHEENGKEHHTQKGKNGTNKFNNNNNKHGKTFGDNKKQKGGALSADRLASYTMPTNKKKDRA